MSTLSTKRLMTTKAKRECATPVAYLRSQLVGHQAQTMFAGSPSNIDWETAGP